MGSLGSTKGWSVVAVVEVSIDAAAAAVAVVAVAVVAVANDAADEAVASVDVDDAEVVGAVAAALSGAWKILSELFTETKDDVDACEGECSKGGGGLGSPKLDVTSPALLLIFPIGDKILEVVAGSCCWGNTSSTSTGSA